MSAKVCEDGWTPYLIWRVSFLQQGYVRHAGDRCEWFVAVSSKVITFAKRFEHEHIQIHVRSSGPWLLPLSGTTFCQSLKSRDTRRLPYPGSYLTTRPHFPSPQTLFCIDSIIKLASLEIEEGKGNGNGKKRWKKGKKGKNLANRLDDLNAAEKLAQTAYERGRLSLGAYNEVMQANLDEIQDDSLSHDAIVADEPIAPATVDDPDPPSPCPPSPVTVSIPESIDGLSTFTIEAGLSEKNQTEDVALCPPDVIHQADSRCAEGTGQLDTTPDVEVKTADGCVFLHCLACPRLDIVEYGQLRLPEFLKVFVEDDEFNVTLILCGTCRKKPKYRGQDKASLETLLTSYFAQVWLKPEAFEKGDGVQAARVLTGREVRLLMLEGGPAYRDIDRIVKSLGTEDKLSSVDMERFAAGYRDHLRLPHLRGGLMSS